MRPDTRKIASVMASFGCAVCLVYCTSFGDSPSASPPSIEASDSDSGDPADGTLGIDHIVTGSALPMVDALTVSAGGSHTCAINSAHDVYCWGSNSYGQLGVSPTKVQRSAFPLKVAVGDTAISIASGARHTCAILSAGTMKCWGANDRGQLGRGNFDPQATIDFVSPPSGNPGQWTAPEVIAAGVDVTCVGEKTTATPYQKNVFCWGDNTTGQLNSPNLNGYPSALPIMITYNADDGPDGLEAVAFPGTTNVISAGGGFVCASMLVTGGAAYFTDIGCWGVRTHGEIGAPAMLGSELKPGKYPSTVTDGGSGALLGPLKAAQVAVGDSHGCAATTLSGEASASLYCWGNNTNGQTGSPTLGVRPAELVAGFDSTSFSALSAGGRNTCILASHEVRCIGANDMGQLGRGTTATGPTSTFGNVMLPPTASVVSVGTNHACAVLGTSINDPGQIACWGNNADGELGDGSNLEVGYTDAENLRHARSVPVRVVTPRP